jgi:hypothetical protein
LDRGKTLLATSISEMGIFRQRLTDPAAFRLLLDGIIGALAQLRMAYEEDQTF